VPRWFADPRLEDNFVARASSTGSFRDWVLVAFFLALTLLPFIALLAADLSASYAAMPLSSTAAMLVALLVFLVATVISHSLRAWRVVNAGGFPGAASSAALALEVGSAACILALVAVLDALLLLRGGSDAVDTAGPLANANFLLLVSFAAHGYRCLPLIFHNIAVSSAFVTLLLIAAPTPNAAAPLAVVVIGALLSIASKSVHEASQRSLFLATVDAEQQRERFALLLANMLPSEVHGEKTP
jgi:hypothetical protein